MSESVSDIINGCYACPSEALQDAAALSLLARLAGAFTASNVTQSRVAVNGDNDTLVAAAASTVKYREIQLQNLGTEEVFVRLGTGAANTGANGEFVLKAGTAADDGTGGTYTVTGYIGLLTGASTGATNVSVTVIDLA
jgi:hypothetical protein